MRKSIYKHYLYAIIYFLLGTVAVLWSWNTLAELFNIPSAQFKHVLAVSVVIFILKWSLFGSQRNHYCAQGGYHAHSNR